MCAPPSLRSLGNSRSRGGRCPRQRAILIVPEKIFSCFGRRFHRPGHKEADDRQAQESLAAAQALRVREPAESFNPRAAENKITSSERDHREVGFLREHVMQARRFAQGDRRKHGGIELRGRVGRRCGRRRDETQQEQFCIHIECFRLISRLALDPHRLDSHSSAVVQLWQRTRARADGYEPGNLPAGRRRSQGAIYKPPASNYLALSFREV
jgi:hypothetical protein